jgi:molecular chaperone GrpE (heat shock protein)
MRPSGRTADRWRGSGGTGRFPQWRCIVAEEVENTEEVAQLELEALRAENEELIDTLQRVKAEFDNYRKRAARD